MMQHIFIHCSAIERAMILTLHVSKGCFCAGLQSAHSSPLQSVQNLCSPDAFAELPAGREQQTTATRMCYTPSTPPTHAHTHTHTHTVHSHSKPTAVMKHKPHNCVPII